MIKFFFVDAINNVEIKINMPLNFKKIIKKRKPNRLHGERVSVMVGEFGVRSTLVIKKKKKKK